MGIERGGRRPPPPRKPSNAGEAGPPLRKFMLDQFPPQDGNAADWPLIADALLMEAFRALDRAPDGARTLGILRRVYSAAENRITKHPAYEQGLYRPQTDATLLNTLGFAFDPSAKPGGPSK